MKTITDRELATVIGGGAHTWEWAQATAQKYSENAQPYGVAVGGVVGGTAGVVGSANPLAALPGAMAGAALGRGVAAAGGYATGLAVGAWKHRND